MPLDRQLITLAQAQQPLFVGIDVGGTSIKTGLVDDNGAVLAFQRIATEADKPAEDAAARIGAAVTELLKQANARPDHVAHAGLATPGPIDIPEGILIQPGNLPNWWGFPIRDRVCHYTQLPVKFANDANAAAYGEYWCGAGQAHQSMILLTLGTGIGGGIVIGDLVIDGQHGCGSECGHVIVDSSEQARRDSLGKSGSLEAYCGAYSVVARTIEALASESDNKLAALGEDLTPLDISNAARRGDPLARHIILETARYLGIGIASLIHTIDPDSVVLGGAMNFGGAGDPLGEEFLSAIRTHTKQRIFRTLREKVLIEFAALGGNAGFIGAAGLARRESGTVGLEDGGL